MIVRGVTYNTKVTQIIICTILNRIHDNKFVCIILSLQRICKVYLSIVIIIESMYFSGYNRYGDYSVWFVPVARLISEGNPSAHETKYISEPNFPGTSKPSKLGS